MNDVPTFTPPVAYKVPVFIPVVDMIEFVEALPTTIVVELDKNPLDVELIVPVLNAV